MHVNAQKTMPDATHQMAQTSYLRGSSGEGREW